MFEWLEQELSSIKTPGFHVVDGPPTNELRDAVIHSRVPLPLSYKEFILKFGNAKLYRRARNNSYGIGIFAAPRQKILADGGHIYEIGFHDGAYVYLKPNGDATGFEVQEIELGRVTVIAHDFEEWLRSSCVQIRNQFSMKEWSKLLHGPVPFTSAEIEILETRRQITWRFAGVDRDGNHIVNVTNSSNRTLPILTLGVRSRDGRLNGAVQIAIGHIGPGESGVVHVGCYKDLKRPEELEIFSLADPKPEDRVRFGELA